MFHGPERKLSRNSEEDLRALETDEGQETYFGLRVFLAVLIVLNLISVALNTVQWIVERYRTPLIAVEIFTVAVVTLGLSIRV
jgi:hypothetical protein